MTAIKVEQMLAYQLKDWGIKLTGSQFTALLNTILDMYDAAYQKGCEDTLKNMHLDIPPE